MIRGCVPKKLLVYGAHFGEDRRTRAGFGWTVEGCTFDWPTLRDNVLAEVERLEGIYTDILDRDEVEIFAQRATVTGPTRSASPTAPRSAPRHPDRHRRTAGDPEVPGAEHGVSSNEMFLLDKMPRRAVIAGGGYIANEFAGILHEFACEVTIVNRGDVILRHYDEQVRDRLLQSR